MRSALTLWLALCVGVTAACSDKEPPDNAQELGPVAPPLAYVPDASPIEACDLLQETVVADGTYRDEQIYGCELRPREGADLHIGRLNAHCREEICGSVMLGWYAVNLETRQVWEWDISYDEVGKELSLATIR